MLVLGSQSVEFSFDLLLSLVVSVGQVVNLVLEVTFNLSILFAFIIISFGQSFNLVLKVFSFSSDGVSFSAERFEFSVFLLLESVKLAQFSGSLFSESNLKILESQLLVALLGFLITVLKVSLGLVSINFSAMI